MRVWYDGVIWSRQALGGVNRYFARIIDGLPEDVLPVLTVERRRDVNFPSNPRLTVLDTPRSGPGCVERVDCDVFHPTYFETLCHGGSVLRSGAPVALTVHDALHELYPELADPGGEQRAWKKALIPHADHVICVSHNTKKDVMEIFGVPGERISVVHHASDLRADMAGDAPDLRERPYFLYVGHRYCYKNVPRLLGAFAALRSKWPDVELRFTGAPFGEAEKRLILELGLQGAARVEGCVPDGRLAALYRNAVALVYPSLYEGFGIPLLEAMACECPVAASDTSSIPEVAGDAGLLFDPTDTEAMAHAMERLLEDRELRASMIARGRERAAGFTWEKSVAATVEVYRALAAKGAGK